jgi:hypothetical protein
VWYGN